ncbi:MAG: lipoyl(octanoyl) transferase LipB [Deltaproteobacteria bacterium]|nr:lipoyl(octanoyl) transferase LipB [Deltaproteobacteria bacterium]MBW2025335.1 lipoyl(octanoyl) transferase LipB [Deltaproteobacteria bacterium]MBW2125202.1 lipoyl(octanoyl) transferase LipB [Deltaproteobacteria bacterium]
MIAVDLGLVPYDMCLSYQKSIHAARIEHKIDDVILLLEHYPVITIGKSATKDDLLVSEEEVRRRGIPVYYVNRGGKATCHYPGQLVAYPIMNLKNHGKDLSLFVNNLEETIIRVLGDLGIQGKKVPGMRGVWVDGKKIASIGIEVKKWVTMHGFTINITENSALFSFFVPCGIRNREITFLETFLGEPDDIDLKKIKGSVIKHFGDVFSIPIPEYLSKRQFMRKYPFLSY